MAVKADRTKTGGGIERRAYPVSLQVTRAASANGPSTVEGYASVTEAPYEMVDWYGAYTEVVRGGAFAKTLSESPAVQLLLNHGGLSMAYTRAGTLRLAEDTTGLHMAAEVNPTRGDVRDMLTALEDGAVDEMSFAFRVTRQSWSPEYDQRDITEVDIHRGDVSVVNFGANPATSASVRAADLDRLDEGTARVVLGRLQQRLAGTTGRPRAAERLQQLAQQVQQRALTTAESTALSALLVQIASAETALDPICQALCAADGAMDTAQQTLAALLGLPTPDMGGEMDDAPMSGRSLSLALAQADLTRLR